MKKLLISCLLIALVAGVVGAQDQPRELLFEPERTFTVEDLGMVFLFPEDWVFDTSDGIQFAENDADLAAELDDDDSTNAVGFALNLTAVPVELLGLEEGAGMDEIADLVTEIVALEVYERFEQAILTYRGIVITGINDQGEEGIAIIWNQGPYVVVLALSPPDDVGLTRDLYYTFGYMIATFRPIVDVEMTEAMAVDLLDEFGIGYPASWSAGQQEDHYYVTEFKSDIETAYSVDILPDARSMFLETVPLEDLQMEPGSTSRDVLDLLISVGLYEEFNDINEHLLFDVPAISFRSVSQEGEEPVPLMLVLAVVGDDVFALGAKAPDEESLDSLVPIVLHMLGSIEVADEG